MGDWHVDYFVFFPPPIFTLKRVGGWSPDHCGIFFFLILAYSRERLFNIKIIVHEIISTCCISDLIEQLLLLRFVVIAVAGMKNANIHSMLK